LPESLRCLAAAVAMMLAATTSIAAPSLSPHSAHPARPARSNSADFSQRIDANDLGMVVTNFGSFACDLATFGPGLEFPRGSGKTVMFAGGLWMGGRVNGQTRVVVSEYSSEYGPGAMIGGSFDDPNNSAYRVYKLRRDNSDPFALADYQAGAVPYGAPAVTVLPDNTLDIPGDQMLWSVYNDANPTLHSTAPGSTAPLGVEVQQTTLAFNDPGPLGRTIYMTFRIINKGTSTIDSLHVGLWSDVDLGGFTDDLAGSVWNEPLGYVYNGTNNDAMYGSAPPAVGISFIEWGRPATASFAVYANGNDPQNAGETYNWLRGRTANGTPIVDPGSGAPFMFAGDPIAQTGSLDSSPSDRRILLSVGAVTLAPGDTVTATWALVVGQENDRLGSLARLLCDAPLVKDFWLDQHLEPPMPTRLDCMTFPSCPRSSGFWAEQCGPAQDFSVDQMNTIAAIIDGRSHYFDWTGGFAAGFCQTFLGPDTERSRAEREVASLLANVNAEGIIPQSGNPVSLSNASITCEGLEATSIFELADPALLRVAADYLDLVPTHPVPIAGTGFSNGGFDGGASFGDQFFGSSLHPNSTPDSFPRVELRFGGTQSAHRYLRFQTLTGGIPSNYPGGRAYLHAGHYDLPFTVWDADRNVQLEVGFSEAVVADDDGTILSADFQPATFDSTWSPDTTTFGGREFLFVFRYAYGTGPESELAADGAILNGALPVLYAVAVKRITPDSEFDDGDQFFIEMVPTGTSLDALMLQLAELPPEQANPVYQQIVDCLSPINHGIGIGPTCDLETAVLISLIEASASPEGIRVAWHTTEAVSVAIERRVDDGAWTQVAMRTSDGTGRITWDDRDVTAGHRYGYRLRYRDGTSERIAGETSLDLPSTARIQLSGFVPNPARGRPGIVFSLATDHPAKLTIHDIAGRRVGSYDVGRLGPGTHLLPLENASMASGVYLLGLTQDGRTVTARSALVR
jgi:hypothetical protein